MAVPTRGRRQRARQREPALPLIVSVLVLLSLVAAAPADAQSRPRPNLHQLKLELWPPVTLAAGTRFSVRDLLRNDGRATAKRTSVGYFLSRDRRLSRRDVRLGARAVRPLRAGRSSRDTKSLRIPAGTATGDWRLLACADYRKRVRETSERDNCRALRLTVNLVVPGVPGGGGGGPAPPPDPAPAGDSESPVVTLTLSPASPNGANGWYTSMPAVHVVADDASFGSLSCSVDGVNVSVTPTPGSTHDAEGDIAVSGDGSHTVSCTATDTAGNPGTTRETAFQVDRSAPSVTLTTPTSGATTLMRFAGGSGDGGSVTVRVWSGATTSGSPLRSQAASPSGGTWSFDLSPVLADGATYTARAEQADAAGNVGVSTSRTFTVPHTLQAAGDIARCGSTGDEATAALLANRAGTVAALGDVVYDDHVNPEGSLANFLNCYEPSWGPLKPRTRPAIGNHEYNADLTGSGYFDYFNGVGQADGPAGPRGKGYYSYDKGSWHVVVLNTNNRCQENIVSCSPTSAQIAWLKGDLAANPATCTLAYFHHPRFSSYLFPRGSNDASVKPIWDVLYAAGADVILNGHAHNYERWRPLNPDGVADDAYGIREFISGEGGASHHSFNGTRGPNSQAFDSTTFGVLELRLGSGSYSWQFVPAPGTGPYAGESGSAGCHGPPPAP